MVDDDEDDPYPINAETEKRCYLSSKRLMYFFGNQFYELARTIGKGSLTSSAKLLGAKVLCREEVEGTWKEAKWHFVPTIEVGHWPDDAFEFFLRKRTVMRDRRTGLSYQVLIHRIEDLNLFSPSSGQQGVSSRQPASWVVTSSLMDFILQGTSGYNQSFYQKKCSGKPLRIRTPRLSGRFSSQRLSSTSQGFQQMHLF